MSKYTLSFLNNINPSEFTISALPEQCNKYTVVEFIDTQHGPWYTAIRNVIRKGGSTHPARKSQAIISGLQKSDKVAASKRATRTTRLKNGSYKKSKASVEKQIATWDRKRAARYSEENINNLLPENVTIKSNIINPVDFDVEKSYTFVDVIHGEFKSSLRCLVDAGYSTHPALSMDKRIATNVKNKKGFNVPETEIKEYLHSIGVSDVVKCRIPNTVKEVDLYCPDYKIGIEYNENYFHNDLTNKLDKRYHLEKTELAVKNNINLMQFTSTEWKKRKEQVKWFLRSKFGKNSRTVYARKCIIKVVDKSVAKEFLSTYHILGEASFTIAYGLYFQDELVSLVSLAPHHRTTKELVLNRYIVKGDVTVVGGLSKLSKYAYSQNGTFSTFVDRRWSQGENWEKCGYKKIKTLSPDYFYLDIKKGIVYSKQSMKNKANEALGYGRVWDCGKFKYRY